MTTPVLETERAFAELLGEVLGVDDVPVDGHFFDELGADSLVMARFCALVRRRKDLPQVSIKQVYERPTIRRLAAALGDEAPAGVAPAAPAVVKAARPASTAKYLLTGALQALAFLAYAFLAALAIAPGYEWISAGSGLLDTYLRSVAFGGAIFAGASAVPILAKWIFVGRWKPGEIRLWSLAYVRFWIVKTLIRTSPLVLFVGSPVYNLYLRALGARVGRGAVILTRNVPVCTDLLTVGDGAVIRKDSFLNCYRADAGMIRTGRVTVGRDGFLGEMAVVDIETSLGDGAQLGHSSSLHEGQVVPAGERLVGSPADERTETDYRAVEPRSGGPTRRAGYGALQLLGTLAVRAPLAVGGIALVVAGVPGLTGLLGSRAPAFTSWAFYGDALVTASVVFVAAVLLGLLFVTTVPRLLNLALEPDRTYRLYGFQYWAHRAIERLSNIRFFTYLFGDSSYIVNYLRWLGYDLSTAEQTGSNFGLEVKHENPFLSRVGGETMAADGLSIINADYSGSSFRLSRTTIGDDSFIGNYVAYPPRARTGANALLATKVAVPTDGEAREDVGLLGSPSFEIPRSVLRDSRFDHLRSGNERDRRLRAKNRHNVITMGLFLFARFVFLLGVTVLASGAAGLYDSIGAVAVALGTALTLPFTVLFFIGVERAGASFRTLRPRYCSIYDPYFWWHERYWKLGTQPRLLDGTPFKRLAWRLLGVRIGRRVFDDGGRIVEKTMVAIGDDSVLNAGTIIQPHSQEDGAFKSDRIEIGAGVTLGTGALVHYGTVIGDGAAVGPDSFLIKGEEVPRNARWAGNPARPWRKPERPAAEPTTIPHWNLDPMPGVAEHRATIPAELAAAVRGLAHELGRPTSAVVLAAHAKVFAALTGERDLEAGSWRGLALAAESKLESDLARSGLDVAISDKGGPLALRLRYRSDALDAEAAERIAGYHVAALELMVADPDGDHSRQSLLSAAEVRHQVEGLAGPRRELPDRRVHELFEARARANPEALAASDGEREWTYGELNARANRLSRALLARGLRGEGVVGVVTERNLDWMAAVLAVFKAGGAYLPIEPQFPADRIAATLSRAGSDLVLAEAGSTATLDQALESLPAVEALTIDAAYAEGHDDGDPGVEVGPDQLAYVYFTSGSTGEPKGAMCEHAGMLNHLYAKIDDLGIGAADVVAQTAPQCFDISLWQLVAALPVGGRTRIVDQETILDVDRFLDTIVDDRVAVLQLVPSYLDVVLSHLEHEPRDLANLRCVSVTGEALTVELAERWFAAAPEVLLVNAYGLTETSDDTNHEVMDRPPDSDRVPLGRPVNNARVYVVDEHLALVPLGAPGEIVFSGVCVGRGYVNDPERTHRAFVPDPHREGARLYRSGDYGRWRPDGKLEFLGRRDAQVKINGFRIEIGDVENALSRVSGVRQGAAVVAERNGRGKRLVAFYSGPGPLEPSELRDLLGESLPAYMVPSSFHWRDDLPLTDNGKVDRNRLVAEVNGG